MMQALAYAFLTCGNFQVRNLELVVLGLAVIKRARRNPTCQPLLGVPEEFACMGYTAIVFSASLVTFVVDIQYYVLCLCVCASSFSLPTSDTRSTCLSHPPSMCWDIPIFSLCGQV